MNHSVTIAQNSVTGRWTAVCTCQRVAQPSTNKAAVETWRRAHYEAVRT